MLIIRYIVNNCKNYLSPKLALNLQNCKNIAARADFIYNILYIKVVRAVMLCKNHAVTHRYYTAFIKQRFAFGFRHTIFWL